MSTIQRNGSRPSNTGPTEYFTGNVRVDPLFQSPGPAHFSGASVTFEPGARSAWHTHPCGQTLIVTAGLGQGLLTLFLADALCSKRPLVKAPAAAKVQNLGKDGNAGDGLFDRNPEGTCA